MSASTRRPGSGRRRLAILAATASLALAAAGCSAGSSSSSSSGGLADGFGSRGQNRTMDFFLYYDPATEPTFAQISKGAEDAAKLANVHLNEQNAGGQVANYVQLIQTAIANKPDAMFVMFQDPSWNDVVCKAHDAGIKVYAYGIPATGDTAKCVSAFVGQDFTVVGKIIGEKLLQSVSLKPGDKVLCPAEMPTASYAVQRGAGVNEALKSVGVQCIPLETTGADEQALNAMNTWLGANRDVKAIVPLGGTPNRNSVAAEDAVGVKAPIIGFDTSPQVIDGIKSGRIIATADQQPYIEGFQSVTQAALNLDFGLSASDINSGGNALIDKSNVANLEAKELQGVRW
ncbi:substrate-binding domain-containing protein [Sinomonas sp. JGH33]|uniref:Substrate-binding domain-containing protein n=1 Tax=Sinomonas terricola TaxID=3110330 RepID=A0ABU5TAP6_9MICC|nr:substrate-binding domain-containing protein [Sinomonas sp. JGH33]MEA5456765.1 substrate-binding domain-containing protein [Sinomonas sp. JGH33]